eukprot:COSAG02_NODE_3413_length_6785_cov_8.990278_7_plen_166_part_00
MGHRPRRRLAGSSWYRRPLHVHQAVARQRRCGLRLVMVVLELRATPPPGNNDNHPPISFQSSLPIVLRTSVRTIQVQMLVQLSTSYHSEGNMGNRIWKGTRPRANREEAILYNPLSLRTSLCSPLPFFLPFFRGATWLPGGERQGRGCAQLSGRTRRSTDSRSHR